MGFGLAPLPNNKNPGSPSLYDHFPMQVAEASPLTSRTSKPAPFASEWSPSEIKTLVKIFKNHGFGVSWAFVCDKLREAGYNRSEAECHQQWNRRTHPALMMERRSMNREGPEKHAGLSSTTGNAPDPASAPAAYHVNYSTDDLSDEMSYSVQSIQQQQLKGEPSPTTPPGIGSYGSSSDSPRRSTWDPMEDELISTFLNNVGSVGNFKDWSSVGQNLKAHGYNRSGKQCRERWRCFLDPLCNRDPFTQKEDLLLLSLRRNLGPRWVTIATLMQQEMGDSRRRPENCLKNRWNSRSFKKAMGLR